MNHLKFSFSRANLTQATTLKAIVQFLVAAGVIHLAPEAQDQVVHWLADIIGGGQAILAVINFLRNERKHAIVVTPTIITTSPEPKP